MPTARVFLEEEEEICADCNLTSDFKQGTKKKKMGIRVERA